jgi:hypothetical protein
MAGRFRPTRYGIEYRTPSNQWLYCTDYLNRLSAAANALVAIFSMPVSEQVRLYNEVPWNDVRDIIAREDQMSAQQLLNWAAGVYPDSNVGHFL